MLGQTQMYLKFEWPSHQKTKLELGTSILAPIFYYKCHKKKYDIIVLIIITSNMLTFKYDIRVHATEIIFFSQIFRLGKFLIFIFNQV